ncbi:MAG TPA: GNAT family N-acetyltransferase [Chloroflexi bacterium]|nr:GNAT family N-acetyltransferase [Chloroflexota bacterium]
MGEVRVRPATLADAADITAVHCSHVETWRRGGKGEPVPYEALSLYERWLHGGPWMSVETCAVHLNRWLRAGHPLLVAEVGGRVVGEAEFVVNPEPSPYGPALHLSLLFVHADHRGRGVGRALVEAGAELARERGCAVLTTQPEQPAEPFYRQVGFEPWLWLREWQAPAVEGEVLAESAHHTPYPVDAGAVLRAGRYQCGRQAWDELPFHLALAEHRRLRWGRWRVPLPDGGTAWLGLHAQPLEPSQADGFIWIPPGVDLGPLVEALQRLAARLGFAYVDLLLEEPEGRELASGRGFEPQKDLTLWRRAGG